MLNKKHLTLAVSTALLAMVPFSSQAAVLIDGGHDWLANSISGNSSSDWVGASGVSYVYDDSRGDKNSKYQSGMYGTGGTGTNQSKQAAGYGKPSGGQSYDAEAMYLEVVNNTLHIAIVTGLAPTNTTWSYGDIFFDLNGDVDTSTYIDAHTWTGSSGHDYDDDDVKITTSGDGYEYGLVIRDHTGNDFDDGGRAGVSGGSSDYAWVDYDPGSGEDWERSYSEDWTAGELYNVTAWNQGINSSSSGKHPVSGYVGTKVTDSSDINHGVISDMGSYNGTHYVVETSISLIGNAFGASLLQSINNGTEINVHWNPLCNNDWIQFTGVLTRDTPVPEPTPLALMAIGFVGLMARRKMKAS